jgi:hypothetical protein
MRRRFVCLAIALIAACSSHKTADEKLLDAADPAASWSATLQLAAEKWLANSVPSSFARATVDAATRQFDKSGKEVARSQARQQLRDAIKVQLDNVQAAAGDFKQAMEKNDRRTVAACAHRFGEANQALQQLENQKDSQ